MAAAGKRVAPVTGMIDEMVQVRVSRLALGASLIGYRCRRNSLGQTNMEPSAVADDLNEISVLVNVAHRLLLTVRDEIDASPTLQHIVDDLNDAHDQLDALLDRIAQAIDGADAAANQGPREQRPAIH